MRKNIRLLIVGDELVGKSSLINTIYSELPADVHKTLKKVILPPEMCPYSKEIFTELIDSSAEMDLAPELAHADLVLLVYDVSELETIDRIESEWLPRICQAKPKIPIILVGNKMDKKELEYEEQERNEYVNVKEVLKKVTKRFKNVQMGIECSAFYDRNVKSVLNCAQRAVLYPLSPLYNLETRSITEDFKKALVRIFRILDSDLDGKIEDFEMNKLQERVFQSELNLEDIKAIKEIILKELESGNQDYIELAGFIALQKKCIEMLKIQICWSILRHFGYNDCLRIQTRPENFVADQVFGDTIELTSETLDFLLRLYSLSQKTILKTNSHAFQEGDSKPSQAISEAQPAILKHIFQSSPSINLEEFQKLNNLCKEKFVMAWSLYAFMNHKQCYKDLLYLGRQAPMDEVFLKKKTRRNYKDYQRIKENKVLSILIIQNPKYQSYTDILFVDGQKVETEDGLMYERTTTLYSTKQSSKTFLLFKVSFESLEAFFKDYKTQFSKRIDLAVYFESEEEKAMLKVRERISEGMLLKMVSPEEAECLQVHQPPQLDLESLPVRYKEGSYHALFNLILESFQKIEQCLPAKKIEWLKKENKKEKQVWIYSLVGVSLAVVGGILMRGKILKLLN